MRPERSGDESKPYRVGADRAAKTACVQTLAGVLNRKVRTRMCIWCRRRDLNPHGLRHTPLKRACLPFHHFGTQQELEKPPQLRSRIAQTLNVLSSTSRAFARCGLVARLFEAPATQYAPNRLSPCLVPAFHASRFTNDAGQPEGAAL